MSCALQEKWNLETLCSDKWTCSVVESLDLFGQTEWPVTDYLWLVIPGTDTIKLLDMDNCIQFVKSHWNPMIVLKLPWPGYLICLYLVLQHLFPASPLMIRLGGLFGGRRHACVMLDRLFIRLCVQALWWCYRLLNGALSANNGEQYYSECSRTKPPFLIKWIGIFSVWSNCFFPRGIVKHGKGRDSTVEVRDRKRQGGKIWSCK